MHKLTALGEDKNAKKAYIQSLPASLQAQIMQALKDQKEQAAIKARQNDAELDSLLN